MVKNRKILKQEWLICLVCDTRCSFFILSAGLFCPLCLLPLFGDFMLQFELQRSKTLMFCCRSGWD